MGICGRILSFYRREEPPVDRRGKACLANGELYTITYSQHLRVRDICIEICKKLDIAPMALDFFTLMTTDCEHCLRPNRQIKQRCDKQKDHYLNPKRVLHEDEITTKVFFFRLAFKAVAGPDLKVVNNGAYEYFVLQCRWDFINGRINYLSRKDHLTLLILESIMRAHEAGKQCKEVLDNPKQFGLGHLFIDDEYSCREIKTHLKKQLSQFKTAQNNVDKAKNSFLYVLESVTDFGVTKVVVKKFYYQSAGGDHIVPVEWEISISPSGLKKRRTYKDERDVDGETTGNTNRVDELISDYKDIEYLEIKQSESEEIIHISRQKAALEVISVGKSMIKKENLITLIEGFYHLFVNQYKTLTKYAPGLELPISCPAQNRSLRIHGPIERKKVESLLKAVETENGDRSGVHMVRRSRKEFDSYILSLIYGSEIRHYEIVFENEKFSLKNGPKFDALPELLDHYKTEQARFPTKLTTYCPIPKEGLCALYDDQVVVEIPCVPSTSRPANPDYLFEYIGNRQLEKLHHTFTCGDMGDRIFKAMWLKGDIDGVQEVFCRRLETSRAPDFREKVIKAGENMATLIHRNLVQFYGVQFNDEQNTYLAFEWIPTGTLDEYLKKETDVTVERILTFAAQIAEACMYLHEKNFVHGWLAAHNVLVINDEHVKLSDVSVPCLREEDMLCETVNINRSPWKARECFQGRRYSKESDVWAFGIVLWEMFMKTVPFQNMEDDTILQIFQQDRHLAYPRWCPDEVGKIMKSCWITEPTHRPTFAEIVVKLRQITRKLTSQEKERKIPETYDEKFTIEPLNVNKASSTPPDECLPRTSSGSSSNNDNDIGSNEGSFRTDDLDFIPEKELSETLWSPEEIEKKKYQGKFARHKLSVKQPSEVSTYDRILQSDSSFEANEQTHLLASEYDRHMNETTTNEVQTAIDDPIKHRENIENNPSTSGNNPIPEDNPTDDEEGEGEEQPLIRNANQSPAQPEANFVSLENMDHNGFLGSFMGAGTIMDKGGEIKDDDVTLGDKESTSDVESGISEQEYTNVAETSEISEFFSANLDPFAAESEIFTSKLNSAATKTAENEEGMYVSSTRSESRNISNLVKQSPSSPYITAPLVSSQRRVIHNGYKPTPSAPGSKPRDQPSATPTTDPQTSFSSGMVEFSKLDPFAAASPGASVFEPEGVTSNEPGIPSQQTGTSEFAPPGHYSTLDNSSGEPLQEESMFSSFLDRDPMSELTFGDGKQPSSVGSPNLNSTESLATQKRVISPSGSSNSSGYVSSYNRSGSNTPRAGEIGAYHLGNSRGKITPPMTNFSPNSGQVMRKQNERRGYISVKGNVGFHLAEKESANQNSSTESRDELMQDFAYSSRDPFAVKAVGKQSTTSGQAPEQKPRVSGPPAFSPASISTGITGYDKLFLKSREAKSMEFTTPKMVPPTFTSPGIKPSGLVPSTQGTAVISSTINNPKSSLQSSPGKPSLTQLALKLSTGLNSVQQPQKAIAASSSPKKPMGVIENNKPARRNPQASVNFPSAANMDPCATKSGNFSGIKLYTEAEPDRDTSRANPPGDNVGPRLTSAMRGYEKVARPTTGIRSLTGKGTTNKASSWAYPKPKYAPAVIRQPNSSRGTVFDSVSKSNKPNIGNPESNSLSEKPGAKMSKQESDIHGTADIFPFSNTNLGDFLSNMTLQGVTELGEANTSQQIELKEIPCPQLSPDPQNTASSTTDGEIGDNELHTGLVFDNMDPFAAPAQHDRKSSQEFDDGVPKIAGNENREFNRGGELSTAATGTGNVSNLGSNVAQNATVFVRNYSNAANPESDEAQRGANLNPPQPKLPARNRTGGSSQGGSPQGGSPPGDSPQGGSPPGGSGGQNPPPLGRKPSRKVSVLGNDYAKVTIQGAYEEPEVGAVGGGEPGAEAPEPVVPVEQDTDGGEDVDDKTVVDPFNVQAAEESIQKLDPYRSRSKKESFDETMKSHLIPFESLTFGRNLGEGAFGIVKQAKLTRPGHGHKTRAPMDVAVKCCKDDASEIYKNSFKQEAVNLMKLHHDFIVKFLGISYNESKNLLLVTELVPQGSLDKYLRDKKNVRILGNEVLLQFAIQITTGMQYLEGKKLVHRDLAARNILVATETLVKISDFGLSRIYDDNYYRSQRTNQRLPIRWLAPECLEQKKFTVNSDVWSLGVTLWEMFSYGRHPYDDWEFLCANDLIKLLKAGNQLTRPSACPEDVYAQIQECWDLKPEKRISFFLLKTMLEGILKDKYAKKPYFT